MASLPPLRGSSRWPGIRRTLWQTAFLPYDGLARIFCLPLRWMPESWLPRARFLRTESARIGHLAIEPDIFLKELILGLRKAEDHRYFWVVRPGKVANQCLLDYWRSHFTIHDRGLWRFLLLPISRQPRLGVELNEQIIAFRKTSTYPQVQAAWGDRPPLLQLDPDHRRRGEEALRRLGLPPDAWFVAVHNREPGFLPTHKYGADFRNASPLHLIPAMEEVVRRGGWCIRMGDPSMTPLPGIKGVIDYAHHSERSDWLDVYLCAACRFFLGCTSGLALVASVFGRPVAQANAIPLSTVLFYGPKDLGIAKLYLDERTGKPCSFTRILSEPASNFRTEEEFARAGLSWQDNSPEEILDLVKDMFDRIEQRPPQPGDEDRERRFLSHMRPGHYAYGSPARIAPSFLRKYESLLD